MTDIVERLRGLAAVDNCQASLEAADEIARLRAENEKLKRSRDRYRAAWVEEKRRFTAARAALSGDKHE